MKTAHISLRVAVGSSLVLVSLVLLRFFQLTDTDLLWVSLMGVGVLMFVIGSRWVLEGVPRLVDYKGMWPVFCAAMVIAWLIHAGQLESYVAGSWLGRFFGGVTVYVTVALLHLTKVPVVVSGDVLSFGPPSLVGAVQVTPLCGGFLSVLMFIAAFSFVTLDVGRALGLVRLIPLLLSGTDHDHRCISAASVCGDLGRLLLGLERPNSGPHISRVRLVPNRSQPVLVRLINMEQTSTYAKTSKFHVTNHTPMHEDSIKPYREKFR